MILGHRTMQIIINVDPDFPPYQKWEIQNLTTTQIIKRLQKCKILLWRHGRKSIDIIILSDVNLFFTG